MISTNRGFNENYIMNRKKILQEFLREEESDTMKYIDDTENLVSSTKMILNVFKKDDTKKSCPLTSFKTLMIMALATNIDVLAIGIGLALYKVNIWLVLTTLIICITTATFAGVYLGAVLGTKLGKKAEFLGGLVLLLISIKILIQS